MKMFSKNARKVQKIVPENIAQIKDIQVRLHSPACVGAKNAFNVNLYKFSWE